jgi:Mg2+/citrate symporter
LKKLEPIYFFLAMALFVIGIHQSIVVGLAESYWIFMICLSLLFLYGYSKNKRQQQEEQSKPAKKKVKKKK